ncbi:translocator of the inner chloroplast envelope membrane 110k [Phaeodactylum tricornutum CCAP 1055/1]|uniref:Translocator of the inner chloroplast envelope membrane 110k n=2 Tax=Phaeodactylum tricornutum TaxID=2850 RepID=B7GEF3_PHATC|nr:translocator of the inner chloroplast envelope membrane 110k [Phaeodactylum tricornutum CCAP 1055/1]EEC42965.1 translocator of the inner chloroplast envelope membrane 110k [Phaeodactylum tricornutum CCAP 1055/1]|eukprot:XP_002185478.1 translocator of the inner chloroplast envelope membrane 110k [Phaeodactylum tricornutum CCAP 1055/1]
MKFTGVALAVSLAQQQALSNTGGGIVGAYTVSSPSFFTPKSFGSSFVRGPSHKVFHPRRQAYQKSYATSTRATLTMFTETSGGMEELNELTEKADSSPLSKQVRKSPSFWKLAGYASIPLSAALGFGLVPSRRLAAHTVGALFTGIAGAVGKSRLDALTESNAKPAIAQAIVEAGLDDPDKAAAAVENVKTQFGLLDEDFAILTTEIYTAYLLGMVKYNPTAKTSELKELETVKNVLQLDNLQVGEAHAAAAAEWYRTTCLFTPTEDLEDPSHPDRQAMDKFLFLTERALKQGGETDEAFSFEMKRVAKAFDLSYTEVLERVAETVEPFYQRALKSTRSKLGTNQVSSAMLERARKTLGVSDATAKDLHVACFNAQVRAELGLPDATAKDDDAAAGQEDEDETVGGSVMDLAALKFTGEDAMEKLDQLREILGLSETDAEYEISLEATPLYQSTALAALKDVLATVKTPEDAWSIMESRRDELLLKKESTKSLLSSMVMQALGGPLEETNKFAKVNNEAATYDHMLRTLEAKEVLISILAKSGWDEFDNFDETFCNPWDKQSANGFLSSDERIKLYKMFLSRSIRKSDGGKISDEMYARIMDVKGLLGITDQQAEIESRAAFGPELQKVLNTAMLEIVEDYTPELAENMKRRANEVVESYRLTQDFLREVGATFYAKAVALVSEKAPGGIPSKELSQALEALRELYNLEMTDCYSYHMEHFGSIYKKSVLEAMGSTGVIRPEFRESLEKLKGRLGVSEEACQALFLEAIQDKMVPMVKWIGSEMERTMLTQKQLAQRRGKDMGEDVFQSGKGADGVLGLGSEVNIMSDIMELVDFYNENDVAKEEERTRTVEKQVEEGGETKLVAVEETYTETVYPVTALAAGNMDQEMAELLYRQFTVGGFTTQGEQGARYEASRETFGGILGLTKEKMDDIKDNIGSTVYDNFISNAMKTKGSMDQQDMMFLANIQTKLGLSPEQGEKMMTQSQKKILSEEIDAIMDDPSPQRVKAFREKCNSMGMDLIADVGISKPRLVRMFEVEVIPGLKTGEINAEQTEIFQEIQESLGIELEECEAMFENVLAQLSKNAFELIKGELLRGREENCVDLIKELVRYADFTEGDLGLEVEEAVGNQVLNIYESVDLGGQSADEIEHNKELLRAAMKLS